MNTRIRKAISLFALCLVVPMGIVRAQATGATCNDGTTSASVGKGACSGHGGVKSKTTKTTTTKTSTTKTTASTKKPATKSETKTTKPVARQQSGETKVAKPATKSDTKTTKTAPKPPTTASASDKDAKDATATCKDGTYSHAATHQGACSGHGGVLKFLKP